jgi:hypothetical protein
MSVPDYASEEQRCVQLSACLPDWVVGVDSGLGGTCVYDQVVPQLSMTPVLSDARLACLARAGADCVAVRGCFGITAHIDSTCTADERACAGDTINGCYAARPGRAAQRITRDCAIDGLHCIVGTSGPDCGVSLCTTSMCDGTSRVLQCAGGIARPMTCQLTQSCTTANVCAYDSPSVGMPFCQGNELVVPIGSTSLRIDCAAAFFGQCVGTSSAQCVRSSPSCDPTMDGASCDGARIRYCAPDAHWHMFDCAAQGFGPCRVIAPSIEVDCAPIGDDLRPPT